MILTKFPIRLYNSRGFNEKHKAKNVVFWQDIQFLFAFRRFPPGSFRRYFRKIPANQHFAFVDYEPLSTFVS